jgi:hypothetical protein
MAVLAGGASMRWFARNAKEWGPRGVLLACVVAVAVVAGIYFATPTALDQAGIGDGPGIPPDLADHQERAGLERGQAFGAAPSAPLPRPDAYLAENGVPYAFYASPNWSGRNGCGLDAVILHVTGPGSMAGMRSWFANPTSQVSAHFGIGKNGEIEQYIDLQNAAWHAGIVNRPNTANPLIADWIARGVSPNRCTVGIELLLGGPAEPLVEYPKMQASLDMLLRWLLDLTKIPADRTHIIAHADIDSINRATDPLCCVNFDAVIKQVALPTATSSITPPCPQYPCLISGGLYRMEDGWAFDIVGGIWFDPRGTARFGPCNADNLRLDLVDKHWWRMPGQNLGFDYDKLNQFVVVPSC